MSTNFLEVDRMGNIILLLNVCFLLLSPLRDVFNFIMFPIVHQLRVVAAGKLYASLMFPWLLYVFSSTCYFHIN